MNPKRIFRVFVLIVGIIFFGFAAQQTFRSRSKLPVFGLLIQKGQDQSPLAQIWMRAAAEEGVALRLVHDEDYIHAFSNSVDEIRAETDALILPDGVSKSAPPTLVAFLDKFVSSGGKLVLVGDALSESEHKTRLNMVPLTSVFHFPALKEIADVNSQQTSSAVQISDEWLKPLQVTPGQVSHPRWEVRRIDEKPEHIFQNYQSAKVPYPHWPTEKYESDTALKVILHSVDGDLIAGLKSHGKGEVLWINLPLAYLKAQTDGFFLHSFLVWINDSWVGLPRLLRVPDGIGGMILNIHVDSNASIEPLETMREMNLFEDGPYSIHFTAGPDARTVGDKLGLNLEHNPEMQKWIQEWSKQGNEIGCHGGWIHDYFGLNLPDKETPEFESFLEKNKKAIESITGKPVYEYSAPVGNQPAWVTKWLENHGFNSYYFTGNTGTAPTQSYRGLEFSDQKTWSFPVVSLRNGVASFEEAANAGVYPKVVYEWLSDVSEFTSENSTVRLFYFHPPGVVFYQKRISQWLSDLHQLKLQNKFRWYTMNQIAQFMEKRKTTHWNLEKNKEGYSFSVDASNDLSHLVWNLNRTANLSQAAVGGAPHVKTNPKNYQFSSSGNEGFKVQVKP